MSSDSNGQTVDMIVSTLLMCSDSDGQTVDMIVSTHCDDQW